MWLRTQDGTWATVDFKASLTLYLAIGLDWSQHHYAEEKMRIGRVANEAGVNIQTLRYYERRGLLPETARLSSGYREYDPAAIPLVRFIKNAQELGFTLREIGELIELRANRGRSQLDVRSLASRKIDEMDRKIRQLVSIKNELTSLVESCKSAGCETECVIIAAMDEPTMPAPNQSFHGGSHAKH